MPRQRARPNSDGSVVRTKWWRYDRYEVVDGFIVPAKGATLRRYDPWRDYQVIRDATDDKAGYETLIELIDSIWPEGLGQTPDAQANDAIAAWCSKHGLLGVLPQQALDVTLAPRWKPSGSFCIQSQPRYFRSGSQWIDATIQDTRLNQVFVKDLVQPRELKSYPSIRNIVPKSEVTANALVLVKDRSMSWAEPSVLLQGLADQYERQPLGETWSRFFPTVQDRDREDFEYPCPFTDEFWVLYAEPVDKFLSWADGLRQGLKYMSPAHRSVAQLSIEFLNALLRGSQLQLKMGDQGDLTQAWSAPSLISMFALMAVSDLTGGRHLVHCVRCGQLFMARRPNAQYCKDTCKYYIQKKRWRAANARSKRGTK